MMHTKFKGHRLFGYREEDLLKVCTVYGPGGHLGTNVTWTVEQTFVPQSHGGSI